MGLTRETGRRDKPKRAAAGAAADGKRAAAAAGTRSDAVVSATASTHPIHCPTCGRAHTAKQHEMHFASHFRPGRPGPEC